MPEPMVMPTTSATELHNPSVRGSRPSGCDVAIGGEGNTLSREPLAVSPSP